MIVYDRNGNEIDPYDPAKGRITCETRTIHHDAVAAVQEIGHWETLAEYPNGGKDVRWVAETAGVPGCEAWDEQIQIQVYTPNTEAELAENAEKARNTPTDTDQLAAVESALLDLVLGGGLGG